MLDLKAIAVSVRAVAVAVAAAAICSGTAIADVALRVFTDTRKIYQGESFQMTVAVNGEDNPSASPDVSEIAAAADVVLCGSQSISRSSISIINGRRSEEIFRGRQYLYQVTPRTSGGFVPGPVHYTANGKRVSASAPTVSVTGMEKQDLVLATLTPTRQTVLVGEQFSVLVAISVRQLPEPYGTQYEPLNPRFPAHLQSQLFELRKDDDSMVYPNLDELLGSLSEKADGQPAFTINKYMAQPQGLGFASLFGGDPFAARPVRFRFPAKREKIDGADYMTYSLMLPYIPVREGVFKFGPLIFKGQIITGVDDSNGALRARTREVYTIAPEIEVKAELPPAENRPASFIGGIGTSLQASASLDAVTCKVGDPLSLKIEVTGDVRPESLRPPEFGSADEVKKYFRVYADSVKTETLKNGRRFTYRLRPTVAGTLEFPPIPLAYFDVDKRDYQIVMTDPIPLRATATVQIAADGAEDDDAGGVLPIHGASGITMSRDGVKTKSLLLGDWPLVSAILAIALPPLLFAMTLLLPRLAALLPGAAIRLRRATASASAVSAISNSKSASECAAAVRAYLSARSGTVASAATPAEAVDILVAAGASREAAEKLRNALDGLDAARFRPGSDGNFNRDGAIAAVRLVESSLAKPKTASGAKLVALALTCIIAADGAVADDSLRDFLWNRAAAQTMRAADSNDFASVAATYRRLLDDGARNGPLFYNLANSLLLAGDIAGAKSAFLRAERYDGSSFATRTGIACIEAIERGASTMEMPWTRVAFFWHYMLPCRIRFAVAAGGWLLFWLSLSLGATSLGRRLGPCVRVLLFVAVFLLAVFGVSSAVSYVQERIDDSAEVTR